MRIDEALVKKAETLKPKLREMTVEPAAAVRAVPVAEAFQGWRMDRVGTADQAYGESYGKGDGFTLDFGRHLVGYVTFRVEAVGSPQDAPLKLKLTFGEMPCEIGEPFASYDGWLSSSWLQEELLFLDELPQTVRLPRRYCFRYVKAEVIDTSRKYTVRFGRFRATAVTSADLARVEPLPAGVPDDLRELDRIGIATLRDCMQTVYEDGPKRDRRLWIGDLRLQAQANYLTFKDRDLLKRCLYMFAGMRLPGGEVGACVFERPHPHPDDTLLYDYALFFPACLLDYAEFADDRAFVEELWPIALEQLRFGVARLDERGVVRDDSSWWCFIDWHDELNKQAPAQAVLIYALRQGLKLARMLGRNEEAAWIEQQIDHASRAAIEHLWDAGLGLFVSGEQRQVSWASQVWMTLAGVLSAEKAAALLDRLHAAPPEVGMNTPYMMHHYVEALFACGKDEEAWRVVRSYWGGMASDGADTFWELYNPADKKLSPYGSNLINSYCHAWSCTPSYFVRRYWK